jgi:hypothetical protein
LAGLLWFSGLESEALAMSERVVLQKSRIEILPGVFIVADKKAGKGWIEAWHILNAALKRCETVDHILGEAQDDDDHDQQPGRR